MLNHSRNPRNASGDRATPFTLAWQADAVPWFWSSSRSMNLLGLGLKPMAASFSFSFRLCNSCSLARRATSSCSSSSSLRPSPATHKHYNIRETLCDDPLLHLHCQLILFFSLTARTQTGPCCMHIKNKTLKTMRFFWHPTFQCHLTCIQYSYCAERKL